MASNRGLAPSQRIALATGQPDQAFYRYLLDLEERLSAAEDRLADPLTIPDQYIDKFGRNDDIDTGTTPEDVWSVGGTFVVPTAGTVDLVSDDANDTAAGTGARSVLLIGVNSSYDEITESVEMNGTTTVTSTQSFLWINRAFVNSVGSGGVNAGNITGNIGGDDIPAIVAGQGQTLSAIYCVPNAIVSGQKAYCVEYNANLSKTSASFAVVSLRTQKPDLAARIRETIGLQSSGTSSISRDLRPVPLELEPGEFIWIRVDEVSANNSRVAGGFEIVWQ